jgi:hypothetical protein
MPTGESAFFSFRDKHRGIWLAREPFCPEQRKVGCLQASEPGRAVAHPNESLAAVRVLDANMHGHEPTGLISNVVLATRLALGSVRRLREKVAFFQPERRDYAAELATREAS